MTDYLNSDAASTWREDIVPLCQLNYESAAVILTDRAESMYSFNTGDEALLSGRFFTDEEYINGDDVCVISAAYAEQNGLRLGDMIQLDYYDSGFGEYNNGATANSMLAAEDPGPYRQRYYMSLDDAIGVCKNIPLLAFILALDSHLAHISLMRTRFWFPKHLFLMRRIMKHGQIPY